ncbi:MAG TPA: hypothetical protein VG713_12460 [Pirellulales bacterium]|nr:hypothetical protein [Pirellulales bacterium]
MKVNDISSKCRRHVCTGVDITGPNDADFRRPRAGQALQPNHIGHHRRQVGQRGVDRCIIDGQNWPALGRPSARGDDPQPL